MIGFAGRPSSLSFSDPERQQLLVLARVFERVAGLIEEVRNVDTGEWVGAFDDENIARLRLAQRLPGAQRRQRAFQAAQIQGFFAHCLLVVEAHIGLYHRDDA